MDTQIRTYDNTQRCGHWLYFIIVYAIAALGGILSYDAEKDDWYQRLVKPSWTPSGTTISIIWLILYFLIALSWYMATGINNLSSVSRVSINILFTLGLILNLVWTFIFFTFRNLSLSLLIIIIIDIVTLILILYLSSSSLTIRSAYLLIPYLIWLLIATYLNYRLYVDNL